MQDFCRVTRVLLLFINLVYGQLTINVKNQGGDVLQETLAANITEDTVVLEFQRPDGTLVTQFLDFQNEVQIFRIMTLSEEEQAALLGVQSLPLQVFCFVIRLPRNDFIAADAIAKLRQKNPNAIRVSEEDRGRELSQFDYTVNIAKSQTVSKHISNVCSEASAAIYTRENDIKFWASIKSPAEAPALLESFQQLEPALVNGARCKETALGTSCKCPLQFCVPWFPCGLKFCRGHDSLGKPLSYRCGIKTCKKCLVFEFPVARKENCLWDC